MLFWGKNGRKWQVQDLSQMSLKCLFSCFHCWVTGAGYMDLQLSKPASIKLIIKLISFPLSSPLIFFFWFFFFFSICYLTSLLLLNLVFLELNAAKQSYSHPSESKDRKNFPMYSEWSGIWTQVFEGSTSLDHSLNLCCVTSVEKHSLETTEISK